MGSYSIGALPQTRVKTSSEQVILTGRFMDSRTILLIDADSDSRSLMERYLREQGYRIIVADDGSAGLEAFHKGDIDLVITDLMLPRRSGIAVLEQIKRSHPRVRVIMLSSVDGPAHRALAELLGADDYLRKPITMNRLHDVVRRFAPLRPAPAETTSMVSNAG